MKKKWIIALLFAVVCSSSLQAQWQSIGSGIDSLPRWMFTIHAVNKDVVWGCATHPGFTKTYEFTRTADGGVSWRAGVISDTIGNYYPGCIYATDSQTAWMLMIALPNQDKIRLFKTSTGGLSWQEQHGQFNTSGYAGAVIHFFNNQEGVIFGSPGTGTNSIDTFRIYRTNDGGANWARVTGANMPTLIANEGQWIYGNNRYENYGDTLWCVTRKARVFKTTDKGVSWQAYATGVTGTNNMGLASVAFQNPMQGIVTSENNKAARTIDGGVTWNPLTIPLYTPSGDIEFVPGTAGTYIVSEGFTNAGSNCTYMITTDGGDTWDTVTYTPAVNEIQFVSPTVGFGGGQVISSTNGGFYKWTGDLSDSVSTGVPVINNETAFTMYPNPANGEVWISAASIIKGGKLTVFNFLGEAVKEKQVSNTQTKIDVADLPAGMYIIQVAANGKVHTDKLVVE